MRLDCMRQARKDSSCLAMDEVANNIKPVKLQIVRLLFNGKCLHYTNVVIQLIQDKIMVALPQQMKTMGAHVSWGWSMLNK